MRTRLFMAIVLMAGAGLMAFGCAPTVKYPPLKPVSYEIPDAQGFWDRANDLIDKGDFGLAKLYLAKAVDADRTLAEDENFKADYVLVTKHIIEQEIAQKGGE